jgi:ATP-dependent Lhr-like helicase
LIRLASENRLIEGEFRPGGTRREWTDAGVLRQIRRRSLARLRREVEPVDQAVLGRFVTTWQGIVKRRRGADALLDAIEQLQGAPLPASILETDILRARVDAYDPADLDAITAAGEIVWVGVEPLGERDGRVALYLADHLTRLLPPEPARRIAADGGGARSRKSEATSAADSAADPSKGREAAILEYLASRGASFFAPLHEAAGGGYPAETVDALWTLVWKGLVTNDTFQALRALTRARVSRRKARRVSGAPAFRSRRLAPPTAEGRWSLVRQPEAGPAPSPSRTEKPSSSSAYSKAATRWAAALSEQLLSRHGVVTREAVAAEAIPGGFGTVYPILKAMEESGRLRRGYFVAGLGATQFALPGALDLLRSLREPPDPGRSDPGDGEGPEVAVLAATDPANPYGATLKWPPALSGSIAASPDQSPNTEESRTGRGPTRTVGATIIMVEGALVAHMARGDRQLLTWLPEAEPQRTRAARAIARVLIDRARGGDESPRGMLIEEIDGSEAARHPLAPFLIAAGFVAGALGFSATFPRGGPPSTYNTEPPESAE